MDRFDLVAVLLMLGMLLSLVGGCSTATIDAARVAQLNDALHAYPDTAEAWVFMPLDPSVYATQRFGVGQPTWVMLHLEKSKATGGSPGE